MPQWEVSEAPQAGNSTGTKFPSEVVGKATGQTLPKEQIRLSEEERQEPPSPGLPPLPESEAAQEGTAGLDCRRIVWYSTSLEALALS